MACIVNDKPVLYTTLWCFTPDSTSHCWLSSQSFGCYLGNLLFLRNSVKFLNSLQNTSPFLAITKAWLFPQENESLLDGDYLFILPYLPHRGSWWWEWMARFLAIQWSLHVHGFCMHGFNQLWIENIQEK